jgi:inosine/xanthosine triphosphate pyrophosphatase family protein
MGLENILMKNPIFLTGNKNKLAEAKEILPFDFDNKNIDLDEIQSIDGRKVIGHKLDEAYSKLKRPVFVDDSSLHIDSMNGFPGALYKFLDKAVGLEGICKQRSSLKEK